MRLDGLLQAEFVKRVNRFRIVAFKQGKKVDCYFPNPSRLEELLVPGADLLIRHQSRKGKTCYDVVAVFDRGHLVSIDSRLPNLLFEEALKEGRLEEFKGLAISRKEYHFGKSRVDFLLSNGKNWLVEVKSCSLVIGGVALFPDVPTERGTRHLLELIEATKKGYRAALVWIVQRDDAKWLRPFHEIDPKFASALKRAVKEGVIPMAYYSQLRGNSTIIEGRIPVRIP